MLLPIDPDTKPCNTNINKPMPARDHTIVSTGDDTANSATTGGYTSERTDTAKGSSPVFVDLKNVFRTL